MVKFRPLRADEVDLRVDRYTSRGAVLLCYKDARCDMRILDETVGAENWQREHYECKGNLFCRVGIKTDDGWAWKADCGTESYTEKERAKAPTVLSAPALIGGSAANSTPKSTLLSR